MRQDMDSEKLNELKSSMQRLGLIQSILVKQVKGKYEIIAGFRRWTAANQLRWKEIPAVICDGTDKENEIRKTHENLFREDVNVMDLALYIQTIMAKLKLNQKGIAKLIGRSDAYVTGIMNLFKYPANLRKAVEQGTIAPTAARELFAIKDDQLRNTYIEAAIKNGITPELAVQWRNDANSLRQQQDDAAHGKHAPAQAIKPQSIHMPCSICGDTHPIETSTMVRLCTKCKTKLEL
jgi:ParB family chromosome partitioning protein